MGSERTKRAHARDSRRGSALLGTLLVSVMLVGLATMMAFVGRRSGAASRASIDDRKAMFIAEGGLYEAWESLRAGSPTGALGSLLQPVRLGDGMFWVDASPLPDGRIRLVATGLSGSGRAALKADVFPADQEPLFRYTIHSDDTLTLNEGVQLDSYDSSEGPYNPTNVTNGHTHANTDGDAASNQDIVMNANATVFGDATPGPGHTVTTATDTYVHGSTLPADEPFQYDPIVAPVVPSSGLMSIPANSSDVLPSGTHGFDDLLLGTNSILTVQGPATIVTQSFSGGKDGRLVIDATAGPVTFYVQQSYTHYKGFESVAAEGSPLAVAFLIEAEQDIIFPAQTNIRGGYYAPNANILFANDNEAWGSFAAQRIEMSSSMQFHYDENLAEYWEHEGLSDPFADSPLGDWEVVAIPVPLLARDRRDPERVLGVDIDALPSPSEALPPPPAQ